jgi:DEAD/DEAH box helicase domain-containing protein
MHDLVGIYERMRGVYRMYLESAFPIRYPAIDRERRRILNTSGILSQPPLVEPLPLYPSSGLTLADASAKLPGYEDLKYLGAGLLKDGVHLHAHQWESLSKFLLDGKDIIVTTGTGSGKTECFLLPILAELGKESKKWGKPRTSPMERKWWQVPQGSWTPQWSHSGRDHAMRVLILYPLNALVEDQLRRLRSAVDSPEVHDWLDKYRQGNRILFGRYTSQTPIAGDISESGRLQDLRQCMKDLQRVSEQIYKVAELEPEVRYYFANIDGGEMWSRQDMQSTPPDILITNYSMLNIMLMRKLESSIFDMTREWLAQSNSNYFTIIVDELHSYRGTPGTEVSYVLRLLLERLDIRPSSDRLRIIGTSASVEENQSSRRFLREFFSRDEDRFALISGKQLDPVLDNRKNLGTYQRHFSHFARELINNGGRTIAADDASNEFVQRSMLKLADGLGHARENDGPAQLILGNALKQIGAVDFIRDACVAINGSVRATQVPALDKRLFGDVARFDDSCATDAMRGLLLALALGEDEEGASLQQIRGHLFFRSLQKLWVCCNPKCDDPRVEKLNVGETRPIGVVHTTHRLSCSCGAKVLDLIVCQICGDVFLGGFRSICDSITILTADEPALEDIPDTNLGEREYKDYGLFWPSVSQPQDKDFKFDDLKYKWEERHLNIYTGEVLKGWTSCAEELNGWFYICSERENGKAFPPKCPNCDADFRRRKLFKTPLRHHRPGFQRVNQVLASALVREIPIKEKGKPARKLVIFTDSRQDAAKLGAGMELDHYRDMIRVALIGAHRRFLQRFLGTVRVRMRNPSVLKYMDEINPVLAADIHTTQSDVDKGMAAELRAADPHFYALLCDWLDDIDLDGGNLSEIMAIARAYPNTVPMWGMREIVWYRLLRMGICPGGTKARALVYKKHPWWQCFNWINGSEPIELIHPDPITQAHRENLMDLLMYEITESLFPNRIRTFESLGLGYATYLPIHNPDAIVVQCINAIVRATCRRHNHCYHPAFIRSSDEFDFPGYCVDYVERVGANMSEIQRQLKESKVAVAGQAAKLGIQPDHLWLCMPSKPPPGTSVKGYRCDACGGFYLHPAGGYCIECLHELRPDSVTDIHDYYRYLAEESGPPFRLHCEELTGQTDLEDRARRQRWFQEIFLPDEPPSTVMGVDLLSVTTTMEAGVDIGSIQGIMLANMPPRRFNYQQRVGRGGRRGAGLAIAVTVCRDRSHDDYYYYRTEEITGAPPPPPYVDVAREEIIRRVFVKEVMRQAFASLDNSQEERGIRDSVHGEFGAATEWQSNRPKIETYIKSPQAEKKFRRIIQFLTLGTPYERKASFANKLLKYIRDDLLKKIDGVTGDSTYTQEALSERLANAGLLPMFGFPTRVRLLFTKLPSSARKWPPPGVIDRDLDLAISVFAPGSQIVKDKEVHTACGVADFEPAGNLVIVRPGFASTNGGTDRFIGVCKRCKAVQYFASSVNADVGEPGPIFVHCPACGNRDMRIMTAKEPLGFFTDFEPDEFEGTFEWRPRATRPSLQLGNEEMTPVSGTNLRVFGGNLTMISLNDNGGQGGFNFKMANIRGCRGTGAYAVADLLSKDDGGSQVTVSGEDHLIALLCRRPTDVLMMEFCDWPQGVIADPTKVEGRAAWYSFSFMMRLAAASLIDMDPRELQAGFRTTAAAGGPVGQAFLSDTLENGAGYCRWLAQNDNFAELLAESSLAKQGSLAYKWFVESPRKESGHRDSCDTSCHRCLRDYENMAYQGLLDWRLALDMARIASNPSSTVDMHSEWQSITNPWRLLVEGPKAPVPRTMFQLGFKDHETFGNLVGLINTRRKVVLIVCHPLWTDTNPIWRTAQAAAAHKYHGFAVNMMNPFRALRRPTDYLAL